MQILRVRDVKNKTGLSRSTIYLMMKNDCFPKQRKLGSRAVGWLLDDVDNWIKSRLENQV